MSDRALAPDHLMSIETLLTLGLTAAILAAAFVLRLVVLTVLRVGLHLAGKDTSWLRPQRRTAQPRPERRSRRPDPAVLRPSVANAGAKARSALSTTRSALSAAGTALLAAAATIWTGATRGAASLERWADRTNERLAPAVADITAGARRSSADIGKYVVAGIATVQHVVLLLAGWLRGLASRPSASAASEPARVIDLDRDDDAVGPSTSRRSESVSV